MEQRIAFQVRMIATLDRGGQYTTVAKMFLRQLEAKHGRHIAGRIDCRGSWRMTFSPTAAP
jgi:hypothetical protein